MTQKLWAYDAAQWKLANGIYVHEAAQNKEGFNAWVWDNNGWRLVYSKTTPDWLEDWSDEGNDLTAVSPGLTKAQDRIIQAGAYPNDDSGDVAYLDVVDGEYAYRQGSDLSGGLQGGFSELTVAFWLDPGASGVLMGTWGATDPNRIWKINLDSLGNAIRVWWYDPVSGNPYFRDSTATAVGAPGWHFVVVRFDLLNATPANRVMIFSGGVNETGGGNDASQQALPSTTAVDFRINRDAGGNAGASCFQGEIAIFNTAINESVFGPSGEDWKINGIPFDRNDMIAGWRWRDGASVKDPGTPPTNPGAPLNATAVGLSTSEIRCEADLGPDSDGIRVYWKHNAPLEGDPNVADGFFDLSIDAQDHGEATHSGLLASERYYYLFLGTRNGASEIGTQGPEIWAETSSQGIGDITDLTATGVSISEIRWDWVNPNGTTDVRYELRDDAGSLVASGSLGNVQTFTVNGNHVSGGPRANETWNLEVWPTDGTNFGAHKNQNGTARNLNAPTVNVTGKVDGSFDIQIIDGSNGEDSWEVQDDVGQPIPGSPFSGGGSKTVNDPGPYSIGTQKTYRARPRGTTADAGLQIGSWSLFDSDTIPQQGPSSVSITATEVSPWQARIDVTGGTPCSSWELKRAVKPGQGSVDWGAAPVVRSGTGTRPASIYDPETGAELSPGTTYVWRLTVTHDSIDAESNEVELTMTSVTPDVINQEAREQTTPQSGYGADCVFSVNSGTQWAKIYWSEWDESGSQLRNREYLQDIDCSPSGGPYVSNRVVSASCRSVKFHIVVYGEDNAGGASREETAPASSDGPNSRVIMSNYGSDSCEINF